MRGDDEDPGQPSLAPTASSRVALHFLEQERAVAARDHGPLGALGDDRPGRRIASSSTGRARQTTTFSSPRNVNAPGYGLVWARTQSYRYGARVSQSMIPSSGRRRGQLLAREGSCGIRGAVPATIFGTYSRTRSTWATAIR